MWSDKDRALSSIDDAAAATCFAGVTPAPLWLIDGGFIPILLGIIAMFWGFSFVCEEYCVPAINAFSKRNKLSDDFAGAILIGAGLSLPVLFCSFIGLFLLDSSIGIGAVLGGNIFNQTINLSISIFVAPNNRLKLDKRALLREVLCYAASNILIIWSVQPDFAAAVKYMADRSRWSACLTVSWRDSAVLVSAYAAYCLLEVYWADISVFLDVLLCRRAFNYRDRSRARVTVTDGSEQEQDRNRGSGGDRNRGSGGGDMLHSASTENLIGQRGREQRRLGTIAEEMFSERSIEMVITESRHPPVSLGNTGNGNGIDDYGNSDNSSNNSNNSDRSYDCGGGNNASSLCNTDPEDGLSSAALSMRTGLQLEVPVDIDLKNFELLKINDVFFPPLLPRKETCYCTISQEGFFSFRMNKKLSLSGPHMWFVDTFSTDFLHVEESQKNQFVVIANYPQRKKFTFTAADAAVFEAVTTELRRLMSLWEGRSKDELRELARVAMRTITNDGDASWAANNNHNHNQNPGNQQSEGSGTINMKPEPSVGDTAFEVPTDTLQRCFFVLTMPLKLAIYFTTPDVRRKGSEHRALLSIFMSFIWLAIESYILIICLNYLGMLFEVNSDVMGYTIGAWAASYPALWSSVIVAREGFGDIVLANVTGSNVFSNLLGLGLPWLLFTLSQKSDTYSDIEDAGVVLFALILTILLLFTYAMLALAGGWLTYRMIPILVTMYCIYTITACYYAGFKL